MFFVVETEPTGFVIEKAMRGEMKAGHKYIQRKGFPGAYKYLYKLPSGQYVWGDDANGPPANHTELPKHDTHGDAMRHYAEKIQAELKKRRGASPGGKKQKLGGIDKLPWQSNDGENRKHSPVFAHVQAKREAPPLLHVSSASNRKSIGARGLVPKTHEGGKPIVKLTHDHSKAARDAIERAMKESGKKESELTRDDVVRHNIVAQVGTEKKGAKNVKYHDGHGLLHAGSGSYHAAENPGVESGDWVAHSTQQWSDLHAGKRVTDLFDKHAPGWDKNLADAGAKDRLSGDAGKHDNFLNDPRFNSVKGEDIKLADVHDFLEGFEGDFANDTQELGRQLKDSGAAYFGSRLKDRVSLFRKMREKLKGRSLNTVTDAVGARGLCHTADEQQQMLAEVKKRLDIVEIEDSSQKAREGGYRAIHVLYRMSSGRIGELQLKTYRQQLWSGFTHDRLYKGDAKLGKDPEVVAYITKVSDYLNALDRGKKEDKSQRPVAPKILNERGIKFPWGELDEYGEEKAADIVGETENKFYVVIRRRNQKGEQENLGVHEFNTFAEAKRFKNARMEKGNKTDELPIGYATSKAEFLDTFHEYRPKSWELERSEATKAALTKKVQRRGKGEGGSIKLTKGETEELLKGGKYALISAGRNDKSADDRVLSNDEIQRRHFDLEEKLIDAGYVYTKVKGKYGGEEDSFLVMAHDADRDHIAQLGKQFNQGSVIYSEGGKHEMIFTTGQNAGSKHVGEGHQIVPNAEDFYTEHKTKDGHSLRFSLNFDFDKLVKAIMFYVHNELSKGVSFVVGEL